MARGSSKSTSGDVVLESRHLMGLFVLMVVIFGVVFLLGYELGRNQNGSQVRAADVQPGDPTTPAPLPNADGLDGSAPPKTPPTSGDGFYKPAPPKQPPLAITKTGKDAASPAKTNSPPTSGVQPNPTKTVTPPTKATVTKAPPTPTPTPSKTTTPAGKTVVPPPQPAKNNGVSKPQASNAPGNTKSQGVALNAPLIPRGAYLIQVAAMTKESDALEMAQALQQKKFPAFVLSPGADRFYHVQVGPYGDQNAAETARKTLENAGFKTLVKH